MVELGPSFVNAEFPNKGKRIFEKSDTIREINIPVNKYLI